MKKEINLKNAGLFAFVIFVLFSCETSSDKVDCKNKKCLSLKRFKQNLNNSLRGKCIGYSYSIFYNDKLEGFGTGGNSRLEIDGGKISMSTQSRIQVASMSKTITAVTTLKLLAEKFYTIDEKIYKYLPPDWALGNNIQDISFKQLLRHETGFRMTDDVACTGPSVGELNMGACTLPNPSNYEYLRCKVQNGVILGNIGQHQYENINYQLLRVIIPRLAGINHLNSSNDVHTSTKYVELVQNRIGNVNINCTDNGGVYHYQFPLPEETHGLTFGNATSSAGANGWFVSALDYGHFLNSLFKKEILSASWLDKMIINNLGCYSSNAGGLNYITHNGGDIIGWGQNNINCIGATSNCWIRFENGLIVVLEVNSKITPDPETIITTAYTNSMVDE